MPRPEFKPTPPPKPTPEPPRRATIAAAAWTVPTLLLAVAAPAAAASCRSSTATFDPSRHHVWEERGLLHNVAKITVDTGSRVTVEIVNYHLRASSITVAGVELHKRSYGYRPGDRFTVPLTGCEDPTVKVTGNRISYVGGGVFK